MAEAVGSIGTIGSVVVDFIANDQQLQATEQRIMSGASAVSQRLDAAAKAPQASVNTTTGAVGGLSMAAQNAADHALNAQMAGIDWGAALGGQTTPAVKNTSGATDKLRDALGLSRQEMTLASRAAKTIATDVAGMAPGMSTATAAVFGIVKQISAMPVAIGGAAGAVLVILAVISEWMKQLNDLIEVQFQANQAVDALDFGKAQSSLDKIIESAEKYAFNVKIMDDDTQAFGTRLIAEFRVLGDTFSDFANQSKVTANAVVTIWEKSEQYRQTLTVTNAELAASNAALKLVADAAPSINGLADALEEEALNTKHIADNTIELKRLDDERLIAKLNKEIESQKQFQNWDEYYKLIKMRDEELGLQERNRAAMTSQAETALAAQRQENASKVAADRAKELADAQKLVDIATQLAIEEQKMGDATVDAAFRAAKANQEYYGQVRTGAEAYYDYQAQSIANIAALDIQKITEAADSHKEQLLIRQAALPPLGKAWRDIQAEIDQSDAQTNLDITKRNNQATKDAVDNEQKKLEAVRAQAEANVKVQEGEYSQLKALGMSDYQQRLDWLKGIAGDETLSLGTRRRANEEYADATRRIDNELQALLKANGQQLGRDTVGFVASQTLAWKQGSEDRIKAEAEFANAVKGFWNEIANTGKSALDLVLKTMKDQGFYTSSLEQANAQWDLMVQKAKKLADQQVAGKVLTDEQRALLEAVGKVQERLASEGITFGQAVGGYTKDIRDNVYGLLPGVENTVDNMDKLGIKTGAARDAAAAMGTDLNRAMTYSYQMAEPIDAVAEKMTKGATSAADIKGQIQNSKTAAEEFEAAIQAAGGRLSQLPSDAADAAAGMVASIGGGGFENAMERTLDTTLDQFKQFFVKGKTEIDQGVSEWGDAIALGVVNRVKSTMDAEVLAA